MSTMLGNLANQGEIRKKEVIEEFQRNLDKNQEQVKQTQMILMRMRENIEYQKALEKSNAFKRESMMETTNVGYDAERDTEKAIMSDLKVVNSLIIEAIHNNDPYTLQYVSTQLDTLVSKVEGTNLSANIKNELNNTRNMLESEEARRIMEQGANIANTATQSQVQTNAPELK